MRSTFGPHLGDCPPPGAPIDPLHPLSHGLIGAWLFNEGGGTRVEDSSGRGNHTRLTQYGGVTFGEYYGRLTGAGFESSNGWCEVNTGAILSGATSGSIVILAAWKGTQDYGFGHYGPVLGRGVGAAKFAFSLDGDDPATAHLMFNQGVAFQISRDPVGDGRLRHIAFTFRPNAAVVAETYIDGQPQSESLTMPAGSEITDYLPSDPSLSWYLGALPDSEAEFAGVIRQILIYDRCLSAGEVEQLVADPWCMFRRTRRWVYVPFITYSGQAGGLARIYNARTRVDSGITRCGYSSYAKNELGITVHCTALGGQAAGRSAWYNPAAKLTSGLSRWAYTSFAAANSGAARVNGSFQKLTSGIHRVAYESFQSISRGEFRLNNQFRVESRGVHAVKGLFQASSTGQHRLANAALARFEIYRGVNAAVNFASAWQTFTGSSFTLPALSAGNTYRFVVRKRNDYGLLSQNLDEFALTLDGSGNVVSTPPSAPRDVTLQQVAGPKLQITAAYDYNADGSNAGDYWVVWTKTGGVINPAIDTPATVLQMRKSDGVAKLSVTLPSASNYITGNIINVLVRVRRSGSPNVDSTNVQQIQAQISGSSPAVPSAGIFLGDVQEQRQVS